MYYLSGNTVSQTISSGLELLYYEGSRQETRNGYATAMNDITFEFKNSRSRHLSIPGRKSNIFQMIAETFWVMAGANAVSPYLDFFLPRAKNYSDDGNTWHGAYGPRMYRYDQVENAIAAFREDGINTRRSYIMIADPRLDSNDSIQALYGEGHKAKDIPCNREIHFYVQDGEFHTKTIQRSGDMLFGTGSINPFEFSFLHELIYNEVKKIHPDLILGSYRWHVTNAHVYSDFQEQFMDIYNQVHTKPYNENNVPLIGPSAGPAAWQHFFGSLIAQFGSMITQDEAILEAAAPNHWDDIVDLLHKYAIPTNSILWEYVALTFDYILSKRGMLIVHAKNKLLEGDLLDAVTHSTFRRFSVE